MKTSKLFEKELGYIQNSIIREITKETLDAAPKCFQYIPASSSGKYHPKADLGEGGLVRHTKTVVAIAKSLMRSNVFENMAFGIYSNDYKTNRNLIMMEDAAISACIIHDCCKANDNDKEHKTRFEHPLLAAELFKEIAYNNFIVNKSLILQKVVEIIISCVKSHMGKWNTSKYSDIELPIPISGLETFVHMCDYIASRKCIDFNFEVYENGEGL